MLCNEKSLLQPLNNTLYHCFFPFPDHQWQIFSPVFLTDLYELCSFLYWNMLLRTVAAALAAFIFPELETNKQNEIHPRPTLRYSTGSTMKMHKCSYQGSWKSTLYKVSNLQTTHLLSCEVLMPISLDRPSKKVMSLAATELLVTKLLRMPQMFTTTSLEGSFWYPSVGSLVTRLFTTFVAG